MSATVSAASESASAILAGSRLTRQPPSRADVGGIQRARLLAGAVAAVEELGYAATTVGKITARARVSRRTFYELFTNLDECLAAVLEDAVACVVRELEVNDVAALAWRERVRAGLAVILGFLDREPALARVCVVEALRAGTPVQGVRERVLARLSGVVDEGRTQGARGEECGALTAEGLVGAAFSIVHARLAHSRSGSLSELQSELVGMIVLPYLGPAAARRERELPAEPPVQRPRPTGVSGGADDPLQGIRMRITYRTTRVLEGVEELSREGAHPSNRQIGAFADIGDAGQISRLLRRLERLGLLENQGGGHALGEPNAWHLTAKGALVAQRLGVGSDTAEVA